MKCNNLLLWIFLALFYPLITLGVITDLDWSSSVINAHSTSSRCQLVLDQKKEILAQRQKITALIVRGIHSYRITPPAYARMKRQLLGNLHRLKGELTLRKLKQKNIEQELIMRSCPQNFVQ